MAAETPLVMSYARMWPREVFDRLISVEGVRKRRSLARTLDILKRPGVYILYRDGVPYYIGKATKMRSRLWHHAWDPRSRHYNLWNFFSFFVIEESEKRDEIEGILIAAMPTANSARPKFPREQLDKEIIAMLREIRRFQANPKTYMASTPAQGPA
jgi:hypothetical protein